MNKLHREKMEPVYEAMISREAPAHAGLAAGERTGSSVQTTTKED